MSNINPNLSDLPELVTVEELSKFLRIGINNCYTLVRSDKLHAIKVGRQIRVTKDSILNFLNN